MMNFKKYFMILLMTAMIIPGLAHAYSLTILETNPSPAQAGEYVDITFQLELVSQTPDERTNVAIRFAESEEIIPLSNQNAEFDRLLRGQTITRTFRAYIPSDVPSGNIPLELIITDDRFTTTKVTDLFIRGGERQVDFRIGQTESTPRTLLQDSKDNSLQVQLENLGEKNAEILSATLTSDTGLIEEAFYGSLQDSVANVLGGSGAQLQFDFDITNTDETNIPVRLELDYRTLNDFDNSYSRVRENIDFTLRLAESPRLDILRLEPLNSFDVGASGNELQITVENIGREEGDNFRVRLFPDPNLPFDFDQTTIFVASNIKPGENTTFIIPFDITSDAQLRTYSVNAEFESLVGDNRYKQKERFDIEVRGEEGLGIFVIAGILVALSLILATVLGFVYKRRKND